MMDWTFLLLTSQCSTNLYKNKSIRVSTDSNPLSSLWLQVRISMHHVARCPLWQNYNPCLIAYFRFLCFLCFVNTTNVRSRGKPLGHRLRTNKSKLCRKMFEIGLLFMIFGFKCLRSARDEKCSPLLILLRILSSSLFAGLRLTLFWFWNSLRSHGCQVIEFNSCIYVYLTNEIINRFYLIALTSQSQCTHVFKVFNYCWYIFRLGYFSPTPNQAK